MKAEMSQDRESVFLSKLKKKLFLNFISIEDQEWISERYSLDEVDSAFREIKVDVILNIFWKLLDDEGKVAIRDAKVLKWNDKMESQELVFESPFEKLKHLIVMPQEMVKIIQALIQTSVKSNPDMVANQKKKMMVDPHSQKSNSLTSSQVNTVSPETNTESSQDAKSVT